MHSKSFMDRLVLSAVKTIMNASVNDSFFFLYLESDEAEVYRECFENQGSYDFNEFSCKTSIFIVTYPLMLKTLLIKLLMIEKLLN